MNKDDIILGLRKIKALADVLEDNVFDDEGMFAKIIREEAERLLIQLRKL